MCWNKCLKIHIFDTVKSCAYLTSTCLQIKIDMRRHETGTQTRHSAFCRGQGIVLSPAPTLTIVTVTTISIWVRVKPESDLRPRLGSERGGRCIGDTARSCGLPRCLCFPPRVSCAGCDGVLLSRASSLSPALLLLLWSVAAATSSMQQPTGDIADIIFTCVISTFKNGNSSLHQWQFWQS